MLISLLRRRTKAARSVVKSAPAGSLDACSLVAFVRFLGAGRGYFEPQIIIRPYVTTDETYQRGPRGAIASFCSGRTTRDPGASDDDDDQKSSVCDDRRCHSGITSCLRSRNVFQQCRNGAPECRGPQKLDGCACGNDQGRPHNGIVNVEVAGARYTTVKKTGHSTRTIILGNQNKQRWLADRYLGPGCGTFLR